MRTGSNDILEKVHICVYHSMKKRELEKQLRKVGWRFLRHGSSHDIWWNGLDATIHEYMPRHREVGELLGRSVLKNAREFPGKK